MGLLDDLSSSLSSYLPQDPQKREAVTTGLLSMGAAMLGAPTKNFGRALGAGIQGGVSGYNDAYQLADNAQFKKMQIASMAFQNQKNQELLRFAQEEGGGTPMQPASAPAPSAPQGGIQYGQQPRDFTAPAPQAAPQPAPQGLLAQSPAPTDGGLFGNIPKRLVRMGMLLDPTKTIEQAMSQYAPTDLQKTMRASGMTPNSPEWNKMLQDNLVKTNYIAPVNSRPGAITRHPITNMPLAFNPQIPEGGAPVFDAAGNVVSVRPIEGVQSIIGATAESKARGTAGYKTQQVYNPATRQMEVQTDRNVVDAANGGAGQPVGHADFPSISPVAQQGRDGEAIQIARQEIADARTPQARAQAQAVYDKMVGRQGAGQSVMTGTPLGAAPAPAGPMAAAPPLGAVTAADAGARNAQDELSKKWTTLSDQNKEAATTVSYLQSIKELSAKASTGSQSDRINYVNGLLALAGSKEKADSVTANDLLKKYGNQIVARLGSGGMGTDAARDILKSAYPNSSMTKEAIHEASDNIIGAQMMTQAKTRILAPHANARDTAAYNDKEMKFDQNADPRIFQYAAIQDPAARQKFARTLMLQDPKISQKIKALESIGAL